VSIQALAKATLYGCALDDCGPVHVHHRVGKEPSGQSNTEMKLKATGSGAKSGRRLRRSSIDNTDQNIPPTAIPHNPMLNAGAILCASLIRPQLDVAERIAHVGEVMAALCGAPTASDTSVMLSLRTNIKRDKALAFMMKESCAFVPGTKLEPVLETYYGATSMVASTDMLATAAATLANGGVNPLTEARVFNEETTRMVLSMMLSCGMYDASGEWAFSIGIPAKSSTSGLIQMVVPGVCGICIWAPPLDPRGNSVKGVLFAKELVNRFVFHHLESTGMARKVNPTVPGAATNDAHLVPQFLSAAAGGDVGTLRSFVERGLDVDMRDYDHRTALHVAASEGNLEAAAALVGLGANPMLVDRWEHKAADCAERLLAESSQTRANILALLAKHEASQAWPPDHHSRFSAPPDLTL